MLTIIKIQEGYCVVDLDEDTEVFDSLEECEEIVGGIIAEKQKYSGGRHTVGIYSPQHWSGQKRFWDHYKSKKQAKKAIKRYQKSQDPDESVSKKPFKTKKLAKSYNTKIDIRENPY